MIKSAATHVQRLQKAALTQMNVQLHHVISDVTGLTGLAILDAILRGERDPQTLAALRDRRIKASETTMARALTGDYRAEHLFTLKQELALYRYIQAQVQECDREIEKHLATFARKTDAPAPAPVGRQGKQPERNQPQFDLRSHLYRILGVNLTALPGFSTINVHTFFFEVGDDVSRFPTVKHFTSWLGLCPDHRITGGKIISARTRTVKSHAAYALRMAAYSAGRSYSAIGDYFRRMRPARRPASHHRHRSQARPYNISSTQNRFCLRRHRLRPQ